ncbi:MAG: VOC family protein [Aurantibacter sp.]
MKPNNPFFADLSTYSPENTIPFYEKIFGWKYYKNNDYHTAHIGNKPVAGLYETPEKFKQMRMPHFWMTYIQVEHVTDTVEKAKELGGIIEMTDEIQDYGKVALIRDTQGAGFTVYEGSKLKNTRTEKTPNTLIWNELHVSDANNVLPFYQGIFDWEIVMGEQGLYKVFNHNGEHIADILEIPIKHKGKYEYWVCTFSTEDLQKTKNEILENGGNEIIDEGNRILFTDNSNEAFFYLKEV